MHSVSTRRSPRPSTKPLSGSAGGCLKRCVVVGQIGLLDPPVRRRDIADARKLQLLDQTVLQRPEHPLRAPARFRRVGRNMLDAESRQGPSHLRQMRFVDLAAGLRREEVVAAAIGVEARRERRAPEHLQQPRNVDIVPSSSTRNAE